MTLSGAPFPSPVRSLRAALALAGLALGLAGLLGCASGNGELVVLDPPAPAPRVGERLQLSAAPLEPLSEEPQWELEELHGGGFLCSKGWQVTYLPPEGAGTYHLVLRLRRADGSMARQVFLMHVLPDISLDPPVATLGPGGAAVFGARVKGLARTGVTWSVEEPGGGTIGADGRYTAPASPGTYHVVATSVQDPSCAATATVRVE